ncbi:polysaccharide deacetylase family protein [Sphaerimonospora sp. CA-214678]|uniref:polysaccharide deacetylase family protein n=1 Tax=Sphaerimonospora sp. CA-214678 TaxID=3240029 RepID=UPI003D92F5A2
MRVGPVLLSLLLLAGCGQLAGCGRGAERTGSTGGDGAAPRVVPMRAPASQRFGTRAHFDTGALRMRLAGSQPHWPGPRLPVAPPPRRVDCERLKCVALTFDDGPGEQTDRVLDALAAHRARATFFMLGQMITDGTREFVRRMVSEGHQLGNHSWDHPSLAGLSSEALKRELSRTQDIVRQVTGVRMHVMRPPYGATNHQVAAATRQEGLAQILWAVDTLDWRDRNAGIVAKRCGEAKPGDIVLMHDIHPTTVQALPHLLDTLDRKGFTYVTVSELLGALVPGKEYLGRPPVDRGLQAKEAAPGS